MLAFHANDNALGVYRVDDAVALGQDDGTRVASRHAFHAGAHKRSLRHQQRHRLALHVGTHQCAVRVVMLKERHQRSGNGDELFGADVDVVHLSLIDQHEVALATRIDNILHDVQLCVELDVGLRNGVPVLFPCGKIEAERLQVHRALARLAQFIVFAMRFAGFQMIALPQTAFARICNSHKVECTPILDAAVWALNEAILVDARKAGERRDEADVRTFRRLDRADASIVRWVHVAYFKARTFPRQPTGPKGGEPTLVRDLRQGVGLVHELRKLRRTEELADRGHDRLRIDQVVRHRRRHLLVHRHLFLDRAFHANQADTELILHQLANRAYPAIAQVIDIVHHADVLAQLEQVANRSVEVFRCQRTVVEALSRLILVQLNIELQAADPRKIILAGIEEHAFEQRRRGV